MVINFKEKFFPGIFHKLKEKVGGLSKKEKSIAIIALTLIAVFIVTFAFSCFGIVSFQAIGARIASSVNSSEKNFPISVDTNKVINIGSLGGGFMVLTDKEVRVYSSAGKLKYQDVHNFSKPSFSSSGKNAVVFDRGSDGYMLLDTEKIICTGNAPGTIITAEISRNGCCAFSTYGDDCTSMLSVYDNSSRLVFQWKCTYEYISVLALSDNGKFCGAALINSDNGDIYSKVQYFGIDYSEPLNNVTVTGTVPLDLAFTKSDTLTLFGDNGIYNIGRHSEEAKCVTEYFSPELNSISLNSDNEYLAALAKYASTNVFEINLFSRSGKLKRVITVNESVKSVTMSDKYVFALAENKIMVYNYRGKVISEIKLDGSVYNILPNDKYIFIYSLDRISRAFSYGDSSVDIGM